jgi:hypothetical protein
MLIKILAAIFLVFLIIPKQMVFAQNVSTPSAQIIQYESVNPGSPYYFFKRLKENIKLNFLTFGEQNKAKYSEQLFDIRFKELAFEVKNSDNGFLENVESRYTNQAGTIIDKYLKIDPNFKQQAQRYLPVLESLRDKYHSNSPYWLMLQ